MNFGCTTRIKSLALTPDLPEKLYPSIVTGGPVDFHRETLTEIVRLLGPVMGTFPKGYNLIVIKEAMDAFCSYGDEVYNKYQKEATGLHLGYYLHSPEDPEIKVGIATTFLEACGDASSVTCEVSYEDSCKAAFYAEKHHLVCIDWPHTHPGFGVFYSGTDSNTLKTSFSAEQHAGIVVDNLQHRYLAYKIIDGCQTQIPIWSFSLNECRQSGEIALYQYSDVVTPARRSISMGYTRTSDETGVRETKEHAQDPSHEITHDSHPVYSQAPDNSTKLAEIELLLKSIDTSFITIINILEELNRKKVERIEQKDSDSKQIVPYIPVAGILIFVALTFGFSLLMKCL